MIEGLLEAIADFHRTRPVEGTTPAVTAMARQIVGALDSALAARAQLDPATVPPVQADPRPVLRHVPAVRTMSDDPRIARILTEFVAIAEHLPWTQTAGYLDRLSPDYLDNYGYVRLLGPTAVLDHPSVALGIGLWGPHLDYPLHEHEAEELYDVLHGEPLFRTDTTEFERKPPGTAVHHAPWVRHAQRFGAEPTVLLYAWTGNISTDAVLVDE